MSIINDALKKAQKNLLKTGKPQKSNTTESAPASVDGKNISNIYEKLYKTREAQQNKTLVKNNQDTEVVHMTMQRGKGKNWIKTVAVIAFLLLCVAGGLYLLQTYPPVQKMISTLKKAYRRPSPNFYNRTPPKQRKYKPGELVLNGVSLVDGRPVALINDEIYEMGESVEGKKITLINREKVELTDDKTVVTIRVR